MRKKTTVKKQEQLIEVRVRSLRREVESQPFGSLFSPNANVELAYLLGAKHGLAYARNDNVYPPAEFSIESKEKKGSDEGR